MKLVVVCLSLAAVVFSVPHPQVPQGVSDRNGLERVVKEYYTGLEKRTGREIAGSMVKRQLPFLSMNPLPLFKRVNAKPVSPRPDAIREQLYYGPLSLKTVQASSFGFR
jgi:hypothetical protein